MNGPLDHARMLLRKAANDLVAAEATLPTGRALDTVCFHAQQAAEKSLKALLAVDDVCYPWTHDLEDLLELVVPRWPGVAGLAGSIGPLAAYAVVIRYEERSDPTPHDARVAVAAATELYQLAERLVVEAARARGLPSEDNLAG